MLYCVMADPWPFRMLAATLHRILEFGFVFCPIGDYRGDEYGCNPGLQYPALHGPVHTPDNNRWDTPPVY